MNVLTFQTSIINIYNIYWNKPTLHYPLTYTHIHVVRSARVSTSGAASLGARSCTRVTARNRLRTMPCQPRGKIESGSKLVRAWG